MFVWYVVCRTVNSVDFYSSLLCSFVYLMIVVTCMLVRLSGVVWLFRVSCGLFLTAVGVGFYCGLYIGEGLVVWLWLAWVWL